MEVAMDEIERRRNGSQARDSGPARSQSGRSRQPALNAYEVPCGLSHVDAPLWSNTVRFTIGGRDPSRALVVQNGREDLSL
jgi:hypothetical protein